LAAAPSPPKTQQSNHPRSDVEHPVNTKSFSHWQQPPLPLKLSSPINM
jgi:hypothetical protein